MKKVAAIFLCIVLLSAQIMCSAETFTFRDLSFDERFEEALVQVSQEFKIDSNDIDDIFRLVVGITHENDSIKQMGLYYKQTNTDNKDVLSAQIAIDAAKQRSRINVGGHKLSKIYLYFSSVYTDNQGNLKYTPNRKDFRFIEGTYEFQFEKTTKSYNENKSTYNDLKATLTEMYGAPTVIPSKSGAGKMEYCIWTGDYDTYIVLNFREQRDSKLQNNKQVYFGTTYAKVELCYAKWDLLKYSTDEIKKVVQQAVKKNGL